MKDGLAYFTDTHLTAVGLVIFFVFFVGVIWWTSLKANKTNYRQLEQLPLNDGE